VAVREVAPVTTICAVIPSIPPRARLLQRAIASVLGQTRPVDQLSIAVDREGLGAGATRHRALEAAGTEWVAFLDDDDEWLPPHIEKLLAHAEETGADLVFPWFNTVGGIDPFPQHFGKVWDPAEPTHTTIVTMVRRELALKIGGFDDGQEDGFADGNTAGEDWRFILRLIDAGAHISHLPERTWKWHHHGGNLSGRSWKGSLVSPRAG
jgi:glycosyltransferase involved in cell wall biosynthesis